MAKKLKASQSSGEVDVTDESAVSDEHTMVQLPKGFVSKEFFQMNYSDMLYRHTDSTGRSMPAVRYAKRSLTAAEHAPESMKRDANNPNKTFIDSGGIRRFMVEKVSKVVKATTTVLTRGVITTEDGEVPFESPIPSVIGPSFMSPERVILNNATRESQKP